MEPCGEHKANYSFTFF
ncbi:hypothetical protein Patl1_34145 [Pistacia atlantica]|uniref:Uncharacterized protein n=1 Tax=Pistacia atlantica TaxID=434234 RepID=A0ACC0ZRT2_9ROSI|nr:hypothetical protein Patl1_34145 [Pistacia atlantica]